MVVLIVIEHNGARVEKTKDDIEKVIQRAFIKRGGNTYWEESKLTLPNIIAKIWRKVVLLATFNSDYKEIREDLFEEVVMVELMNSRFKDVALVYIKEQMRKEIEYEQNNSLKDNSGQNNKPKGRF